MQALLESCTAIDEDIIAFIRSGKKQKKENAEEEEEVDQEGDERNEDDKNAAQNSKTLFKLQQEWLESLLEELITQNCWYVLITLFIFSISCYLYEIVYLTLHIYLCSTKKNIADSSITNFKRNVYRTSI